MKYMNLINNFIIVVKFDECRCSPINLMTLDFGRLYSVMVLLINDAL